MIIADNDFKNYQTNIRESKAFLFSPGGRWCQSFLIIWTPGYLCVVGDMGDLIIRVEALEDFISCMQWVYEYANPYSIYFMEKVLNHSSCAVFDGEKTKQNLIESFSDMTAKDVKEYAENILTYDFLDKLFDYNLAADLTKMNDGEAVTGEHIIDRLKEYDITEDDAEKIADREACAYTYDWDFLNCRIEAIKEFAKKQLDEQKQLEDKQA